jgi:hypothetical protein
MCSDGGVGAIDGVGFHPYSAPVLPSYAADWNAWQQMNATKVSVAGILATCPGGPKPIWATEYGAPTNGPGQQATQQDPNLAHHPDHVDEELQAAMATDSVASAARAPNIAALFWYTSRDANVVPVTNAWFYGLRRFDGSAKPAWAALHDAIARVGRS